MTEVAFLSSDEKTARRALLIAGLLFSLTDSELSQSLINNDFEQSSGVEGSEVERKRARTRIVFFCSSFDWSFLLANDKAFFSTSNLFPSPQLKTPRRPAPCAPQARARPRLSITITTTEKQR